MSCDVKCDVPGCDVDVPHEHTQVTFPNGTTGPGVMYYEADLHAEVRDPDTGEVIFPAVKGPLKLIQGGKQ